MSDSETTPTTVFGPSNTDFTGHVVKVIVENGTVAFNIHEKILRDSSAFFDKALSGTWKEATERTVDMPLDEAEIFEVYAQWLYTSTLPDVLNDTTDNGPNYLPFAKAWVFGDKVLDSRFRNTIIDAIMENKLERCEIIAGRWYWTPSDPVIPYIYNNTTRESPLRRLLLDIWVRECNEDWFGILSKKKWKRFLIFFFLKSLRSCSSRLTLECGTNSTLPTITVAWPQTAWTTESRVKKTSLQRKLHTSLRHIFWA